MELQQRPNDEKTLSLLPRLKLADLQRRIDFHKVQVEALKGGPLLINDLPTNSVSYIDFGLDCSGLTAELLPYLNLFGTIVTEIGTNARDYMQFATALGICTGGFTHSFNTYTHMDARENVPAGSLAAPQGPELIPGTRPVAGRRGLLGCFLSQPPAHQGNRAARIRLGRTLRAE